MLNILVIFLGMICFYRGLMLTKTKNIDKYGNDDSKMVKNKQGYINLFSKVYFSKSAKLIFLGIFFTLDDFYINISIGALIIVPSILIVLFLVEFFIANEKRKKFIELS